MTSFSCFVVIILVLGAWNNVASAQVAFKTFKANLNAPVLVLDAASLVFPGTHAARPLVKSAKECLAKCTKVTGCNAYTFCNKPGGCAKGCVDYVKQHPTLQTGNGVSYISPDTQLPILSLGPFSSYCQADAWPYGLCTLKKISNPSKPSFYSKNKAEGWVSGTIVTPPRCNGVSADVCASCLKSRDPTGCLNCARSMGDERMSQLLGNTDTRSLGCPACFTSTTGTQRAQCVTCLQKNQECKRCALGATKSHSVGICLNCFNKEPVAARSSCVNCAHLPNPTHARRCATGCLPKLRKTWCPSSLNGVSTGRRANCTRSFTDVCTSCATSPYFNQCLDCAVKRPGSSDCGACTSLDAKLQLKCFKCAVKSYAEFSPCADCLRFGDKAGKCFKCAQDPRVSYEGKSWCMGCSNWFTTAKKQDQCHACLRKPQVDYFNACAKI